MVLVPELVVNRSWLKVSKITEQEELHRVDSECLPKQLE